MVTYPCFKAVRLNLKSNTDTAHTMDGDDPDLEAFESNLRPILRARELGKTVALVSSLFLNLSDPQKICVSSIVYAQIPLWHITSHCQSDSDVT